MVRLEPFFAALSRHSRHSRLRGSRGSSRLFRGFRGAVTLAAARAAPAARLLAATRDPSRLFAALRGSSRLLRGLDVGLAAFRGFPRRATPAAPQQHPRRGSAAPLAPLSRRGSRCNTRDALVSLAALSRLLRGFRGSLRGRPRRVDYIGSPGSEKSVEED